MAVSSPNGRSATETEEEWESASHYSTPELEWEEEAAHYSNPYSNPELEWEMSHYSSPFANPEFEWEEEAAQYSSPEAGSGIAVPASAVGGTIRHARALVVPAARAAPGVAAAVLGSTGSQRSGRRGWRRQVSALLRQLSRVFAEGEREAEALEASHFGTNEFEGELASHESAHEVALTEVLAAEAAHTESESEAAALLGAALPITIRIMGGRRALLPLMPTLGHANSRLVRSIRRSGSAGPQLLRAVPAIQRRTVASLRAVQRAGRPITPGLVARVMAGHAARVLGSSQLFGRAIVRNSAIRRGTVAPAGQIVRPRRPVME